MALLANIFRITLTGVLYDRRVGGEAPSTFYHNLAGWVMMPLALVLYWIVIAVLSRLRIEEHPHPALLERVKKRRPTVPAPIRGSYYKPSIT